MANSDLDRFLESSYQGGSAEALEFSVDTERGKEVLRHALKDDPAYFLVDLLAAAGLAGSDEIDIVSVPATNYLQRLFGFRSPELEVRFSGRECTLEELKDLPDHLYQAKDRFLFRLSLAYNRAVLLKHSKVSVESWNETTCVAYHHSAGFTGPDSRPHGPKDSFRGLSFRFLGIEPKYALMPILKRYLSQSLLKLRFNGIEVTAHRLPDSLWSKKWENSAFPLLPTSSMEPSPGEFSVAAHLSSRVEKDRMYLVPVLDGIRLDPLSLTRSDYSENFVPGLKLFVHKNNWQLDASHRNIVQNARLKSDLCKYLKPIKASLAELLSDPQPQMKQFLLAHQRDLRDLNIQNKLSLKSGDGEELPLPSELATTEVAQELRGLISDDDQEVLETFMERALPYRFLRGYGFCHDSLVSADGQWFVNHSPLHFMTLNLREAESGQWETYSRATIVSVTFHPTESWLAILTHRRLRVWDLQARQSLHESSLHDAQDLSFSRCGQWLHLASLTSEGQHLRRIKLDDWSSESVGELPLGKLSFVGDFVLVIGSTLTVHSLENLQCLYRIEDSFQDQAIEDVSPDQRYVLLNVFRSAPLLLDLQEMKQHLLEQFGSNGRFSWSSDRILGEDRFDLERAQQEPKAKTLNLKDMSEMRFKDTLGGVRWRTGLIRSAKHSFYPAPLNRSFQLKQVPKMETGLSTLKPQQLSPLGTTEALVGSHMLPSQPRVFHLAQWAAESWRKVWRCYLLECSLAPTRLSWETPNGVFILDRSTGNIRHQYDAQIVGSALLARPKKNTLSLVHPGTGALTESPKNLEATVGHTHRDLQHYIRYLHLQAASGMVLVDVEKGLVHGSMTVFNQLQTNGTWLLRTVFGLTGSPIQYYKSYGRYKRWKKTRIDHRLALHPTKSRGYYPTLKGLAFLDFQSSHKPTERPEANSHLALSPQGGLALKYCGNGDYSEVFDTTSLEHLVTFPGRADWLTESVIYSHHDGALWVAEPAGGWVRPRPSRYIHRQYTLKQGGLCLMSDGISRTALLKRVGQIDIVDMFTGAIKAILHPLGDEWFVFRLDGTWDCSPGALQYLKEKPDPKLWQPGLLWRAVQVTLE